MYLAGLDYDEVRLRDRWEELFAGLAVAADPTPKRSSYPVLELMGFTLAKVEALLGRIPSVRLGALLICSRSGDLGNSEYRQPKEVLGQADEPVDLRPSLSVRFSLPRAGKLATPSPLRPSPRKSLTPKLVRRSRPGLMKFLNRQAAPPEYP